MRWKNAWTLCQKDLDEVRKQKLVIGSVIFMPLFLGALFPTMMMTPFMFMGPIKDEWDVPGLVDMTYGIEPHPVSVSPNRTIENVTLEGVSLSNAEIRNATLKNVVIDSCVVRGSRIANSTVFSSVLEDTWIESSFVRDSKGDRLDGQDIVMDYSDLKFVRTRENELMLLLPQMINMVLVIFIIIPCTLPTIIASYSIVGEKNARSLEPLLATPVVEEEILMGKVMSAFVPTMLASWGAFCLGATLVNAILLSTLGSTFVDPWTWIAVMFVLAPVACLMTVLACVIISSKVTTVQAAQQLGGLFVMPVTILMFAVLSGVILLSPLTVLAFSGIYALIDIGLFQVARRVFNREDILVKWA